MAESNKFNVKCVDLLSSCICAKLANACVIGRIKLHTFDKTSILLFAMVLDVILCQSVPYQLYLCELDFFLELNKKYTVAFGSIFRGAQVLR